jgi:NTP pyrophosphatase (non-canonical NTP hydrolase)
VVPHAQECLVALSRWIDDAPQNRARDPEARLWGRVAKVAEEAGEVTAALIGMTGQNPRKGVTHARTDVEKELLDVAVTALCAVEHLRGNSGSSLAALEEHLLWLTGRAGLLDEPHGRDDEPRRTR